LVVRASIFTGWAADGRRAAADWPRALVILVIIKSLGLVELDDKISIIEISKK